MPDPNYKLLLHISQDFNTFIAISLRKTAIFWITENHFLLVGLLDMHWRNPGLENLVPSHPYT